ELGIGVELDVRVHDFALRLDGHGGSSWCCDPFTRYLVVMVGLVPTIHPTACSGVRGWLDPRDKPEDDRGNYLLRPKHIKAGMSCPRVLLKCTHGKPWAGLPDTGSRAWRLPLQRVEEPVVLGVALARARSRGGLLGGNAFRHRPGERTLGERLGRDPGPAPLQLALRLGVEVRQRRHLLLGLQVDDAVALGLEVRQQTGQ